MRAARSTSYRTIPAFTSGPPHELRDRSAVMSASWSKGGTSTMPATRISPWPATGPASVTYGMAFEGTVIRQPMTPARSGEAIAATEVQTP
ncbi:hypothetical protein [Streptomyces sp. V3I7]|uniref:hypothetical protein n=1 Tax=Streptomyces sp. V3I7 TaxID=3042278 RepID=UPI0027D90C4D|nr:hypothetical protein [Streptomyces sp. V3I7]